MDLKVTILLLMLSRVVRMTDLSHNLHCVNDYVSTINCNLQSNFSDLIPKKLKLRKSDGKGEYIQCLLDWQIDHFFCTGEISSGFMENEVYRIFLCYRGEAENCKQLDDVFIPDETIKPKPPCCLTLSQNSSQHSFSWNSTYEEYSQFIALDEELKYQLRFYQSGQEFNGIQHDAYTELNTLTIQDGVFKPDFEYAAKVRSSPNNAFYKGQWSDWSTEIYWRTPPMVEGSATCLSPWRCHGFAWEVSQYGFKLVHHHGDKPVTPSEQVTESIALALYLKKVLIPVCVLVPLFLFSCFIPVKKWKRNIFIPTPEPYFHTLYMDYHGDFKSWVVMEKTVELPKTEKTIHIDKIFECKDICEAAPSVAQSSGYANVSEPEGALPESESAWGPDSAMASCSSAYRSPQSRSPAEGDSGCWLTSDQSLERAPSWYCNDYCTLSTFQQSALGTSEPLKFGTFDYGT